jgi:hypothetical protein
MNLQNPSAGIHVFMQDPENGAPYWAVVKHDTVDYVAQTFGFILLKPESHPWKHIKAKKTFRRQGKKCHYLYGSTKTHEVPQDSSQGIHPKSSKQYGTRLRQSARTTTAQGRQSI